MPAPDLAASEAETNSADTNQPASTPSQDGSSGSSADSASLAQVASPEQPVVTEQPPAASQPTFEDSEPTSTQPTQTAEQTAQLEAALKDLPDIDNQPKSKHDYIVSVHKHNWPAILLRWGGTTLLVLIILAIILDLLLDAGVIHLGINPLTNFFK
jgi:hypothetical protein